VFFGFGIVYYIRVRPTISIKKVLLLGLGVGVGWLVWLIYLDTVIGRRVTDTLGVWPSLIIGFSMMFNIIILTGDWISKKRNSKLSF
jgi:hypothetical protein